MDNNNLFFSIGEFAELCNTTRVTLYHYEKHGLLIPTVNENNGYRFYKPADYYTFMFIFHLANIGFSLNEIGRFLKYHTVENYFEIEKIGTARFEERMQQFILRNERTKRGMENMHKFINLPRNCPQIVYKEEAYFFKIPLPENATEYDSVKAQSATDKYAEQNHLDRFRHFLGFYFDNPFSSDVPAFNSVLGQIRDKSQCDRLFIRPAGMYISMCFSGPFQEQAAQSFGLMKKYLEQHRFVPLSGMMMEVVIGPFHTSDPSEYISELTIQIE